MIMIQINMDIGMVHIIGFIGGMMELFINLIVILARFTLEPYISEIIIEKLSLLRLFMVRVL